MKLYNTLSRQIETIKPLNPPQVTIYTCGPTVYDYAHVGHWFNYIRMDTLIRVLKLSGLKPKWVLNITDVGHLVSDADDGEDKLEKGAKREGKTAWEIAEFYTADFLEGMKLLSMLTPDHIVKATEHIKEQIELIKVLEEKGYAYIIADGVYYDTSKFEGYSAFARLDLDDQQTSDRIVVNPEKHSQSDFALWKFSPKDSKRDMEWDSPWGKGFPGWHIECSTMSMKYLGVTLDIHTGGIDHVPVHHTNEIAQSEAVTGKRFANYWMHSNHIMVNGEKISKSLGNGIRLQEIIENGFTAEILRLHILESHYRNQSTFSWESLEAAKNRLKKYQQMAELIWQPVSPNITSNRFSQYKTDIQNALENDLNTPEALAILSAAESDINTNLLHVEEVQIFKNFLSFINNALGIDLVSKDITQEQKTLIIQRVEARNNKDWEKSDEIRNQLMKQGVGVRDTDFGIIWYRI
jgi:cysteinyl-tRNA synthetase